MSVIIRTNTKLFERVERGNWRNGLRAMGDRILMDAIALAPELSGELKSDGRVEVVSDSEVHIKFGDARVPYARRRHFENKKNPHTKYYLKKAGDNVVAKLGFKEFLR